LQNEVGRAVGCYIYYAKQGEIGEVVYLGAEDSYFDQVFDHVLHDAAIRGVIGLQGKLEPRIVHKLSKRSCFFYRGHDPLLVHSRKPELTRLVQTDGLNLTRLDGEWCFKFGADGALRDCARRTPKLVDTGRFALAMRALRP
jgi:hypothetical protein